MISIIKNFNNKETYLLIVFSLFCFGLSLFRWQYTGKLIFLFLNWNLFLACIPWLLSTVMAHQENSNSRLYLKVVLLAIWLLFFPNAPYILTDLFHIKARTDMPIWFDLILILSYAWTGLLFGFLSLWNIEKIFSVNFSTKTIRLISSFLLVLGSFGIYIGRYLRWNSWDIVARPYDLMSDIGERFINPTDHLQTWGMTILMGVFLNMVYWSLLMIKERK